MSQETPETELVHIGIRAPKALKDRLQQMADEGHRKLTNECMIALNFHAYGNSRGPEKA